jgi:hypothetical protein
MCCFSAPTKVFGTQIFARVPRPGSQVLAYRMQYAADKPTAMILPLPIALSAREDSVRFVNLKGYAEFFDALQRGFPEPPPPSGAKGLSAAAIAAAPTLEVHEVGDFVASFVPGLADFRRVDPRFVLSRDVWNRIPAYADYGFAVFQLKSLSGSPHPIAFEFESRLADSIYFPTVHIHDGSVHATDEFDHVLYLQAPSFDARASDYAGPDHADKSTGFVRSESAAKTFVDGPRSEGLVDPNLLVHKTSLHGSMPNTDMVYAFDAGPAPAHGCSRCDVAGASSGRGGLLTGTAGAAAVGLAWVIRRREALRRERGR